MEIKLIKTNNDYELALERVDELLSLSLSDTQRDELELLVHLIEIYEDNQFPINLPSPVDAILFRMEQQNLKQRDLVRYIGSKSRVSEVLNRKRPLTIKMIRALSVGLNIPTEVLIQDEKFNINTKFTNVS